MIQTLRLRAAIIAALLISWSAVGQYVPNYAVSTSSGTYTPIATGTSFGTNANDDQSFLDGANPLNFSTGSGIDIGFNFVFNGQIMNKLGVNANGFIALGNNTVTITSSYGGFTTTQNLVKGFNHDLQSHPSGDLRVATVGTAPNRECVIQWTNYKKYGTTYNSDTINFQIRLVETSNNIALVYGKNRTAYTGASFRPTLGLSSNGAMLALGGTTWTTTPTTYATYTSTNNLPFLATAAPDNGRTILLTAPTMCVAPIVTAVTTTTSATLTFANGTTGTTYSIEYGLAPLTAGTGTVVSSATSPYTISGLTPGTNYSFIVTANCGASLTNSNTLSVATQCAVISTFPYIESFESASWVLGNRIVPPCYSNTNNATTTSFAWLPEDLTTPSGTSGTGPTVPQDGLKYVFLETSFGSVGNSAYLEFPEFNTLAVIQPKLKYYYHMFGATTGKLIVEHLVGSAWVGIDSLIGQQQATTGAAWLEKTVDLPASASVKIRFRGVRGTSFTGDISIDNVRVQSAITPTCPITAVPTVPGVTTCGPQSVTLSATWANPANQHIWLSPAGVINGRGNTFTTPVLTASATQNSRLIGRDNMVSAVSGGPQITLTNPAGSGGNFTNGMWFTATQPFMLDSATVKAYATTAGGTIKFLVRISEKAGTHAANSGAQLYQSDTITVTTTSTTGELKRIPINIPVLPGSYYVNLNFVAGTTGTLFRSTALPTGTTYPYALGGLGSLDSVQFGTIASGNTRVYYLFNWKMSAACLGPIVTTNVTYASVPSVTLPHVSGFATGAPCNWVATAASGATWQGKAGYTGNGYTATTLNGTPFVMVDDDAAGSSAASPNSILTTPSFPALGYDTLRMKFLSVFKGGSWGGKGYVEVWRPTNGVFGWQTIDSLSADEGIGAAATGWAAVSKSYNVTAYQSNQFKARFRYNDKGLWAGWWAIDQFELNGTQSPTGNVRVAVTTDIYGSEVSWKIVNTSNKLVYASGGPFPDVTPYVAATATHIDTVQIPVNGTYEFRITDSYGDGLTDGTNNGTYLAQVLCAYGPKLIDQGTGALPNDPGGATANVASWDSAVFNMDCRQPATYHVSVNMNQQTVSTNGVHIAGNFQGWNPSATAMTDANGDGVYEYTISTFVGEKIEYKFINGNAWGSDESVPVACRVPGTLNRGDSIANVADSAATVCYALCFNCAGVTFNVDMNQVTQAFTTPEVNGLWNNWCGNCNPLTDANGDGIWTTTLPLPVGTTQEYKFSADAWTIQEQNNPAAPCTNGNATYTNRVLVIPATDTVLSVVCWSQCTACDVDVTLKVNMAWEVANNAISANGVHVAGDFQGWSPSTTPMTDANNDGIYEVTVTVPANSSIQYKFINGNAWGADESVPSACVVPTTMNRGASFTYGDSTLNPVCFGKCTDCAASLGESLQNVSLFPNPTRGQFNLARMDAATEVEVSVLDLQGKVLTVAKWNEGVETLSIDLSSFANGVYMVRMTSDEGSRTMRVSVQK